MLKVWSALVAASMLSGCVAAAVPLLVGGGSYVGSKKIVGGTISKSERYQATADAIGGDLRSGAIKMSKIRTEGDTEHWSANTPIGLYSCTRLVGRAHVTCVKAGDRETVDRHKR